MWLCTICYLLLHSLSISISKISFFISWCWIFNLYVRNCTIISIYDDEHFKISNIFASSWKQMHKKWMQMQTWVDENRWNLGSKRAFLSCLHYIHKTDSVEEKRSTHGVQTLQIPGHIFTIFFQIPRKEILY